MPVDSVFAALEPLLPSVQKPIQYVGGELHAVVKDWDSAPNGGQPNGGQPDGGQPDGGQMVRWALMYSILTSGNRLN